MAKTCTIIKAGRADTYGRPLLVGQSYTGPDDEVFSLWQSGFASVAGAPGAFMPATQIQQFVIAQINIPFLIMPGDGAANGCQFTGTNGAFTLSAAIISGIGVSLTGCYSYFSSSFGGSSLPAGWYWTEFSSDTAGIVYAETYMSGIPTRPVTKTQISPNLSGWITATTNEVTGPSGFVLQSNALGKNGNLQMLFTFAGSTAGTKTYRGKIGLTQVSQAGITTSPIGDILCTASCADSTTIKILGRNADLISGVGQFGAFASNLTRTVDTSVEQEYSVSLQQSTNVAASILMRHVAVATYGA